MKRGGLSDHIVKAFTSNAKEQKALEKTIQAIGSEENYAMKLMELSNRETRVQSSRLKRDVSRIRSNLTAEQISKLQLMEKSGKLKPMYNSMKANGSHAIAQAASRLKLDGLLSDDDCPKTDRSGSIAPMYSDRSAVKQPPKLVRSKSAITFSLSNTQRTTSTPMPLTSRSAVQNSPLRSGENVRINIFDCNGKLSFSRPTTSRTDASNKGRFSALRRSKTSIGFSSHDLPTDDQKKTRTISVACSLNFIDQPRTSNSFNDDANSLHSNDQQEGLRQELLEQELNKSQQLKNKQQDFMNTVSKWVSENSKRDGWNSERAAASGLDGKENSNQEQKDEKQTDESQSAKEKSAEEQWQELRKIRYLRISEDLADLSGVVTLVKDQKMTLPRFGNSQRLK